MSADHIVWALALIAVIVAAWIVPNDNPDPNEEPRP
jgi:hypothetical protein